MTGNDLQHTELYARPQVNKLPPLHGNCHDADTGHAGALLDRAPEGIAHRKCVA